MACTTAKFQDLPDDCILVFTKWLTIVDIIHLRMTCSRMNFVTRTRSIWYLIYMRLSRLVPMLPLPPPYTIDELGAVPAHLLEYLSIFALRLHRRFIEPTQYPSSLANIPLHPETSTTTSEPGEIYVFPGGRWLIEVASYSSWTVSVWDLEDNARRRMVHTTLATLGAALQSVTSAVVIFEKKLYVFLHGLELENERPSSKTIVYVVSVDLDPKTAHNPEEIDDKTNKVMTRLLPCIAGFMGLTTPVDVNANLLSFHAKEEEELYIIDWTYDDSDSNRTLKGVIIRSFLLAESQPDFSTWTRVLATGHLNYLLFLTSDGSVALFLIPPLTIAQADDLPRAQLAPIVHLEVPSGGPITYVSPWSSSFSLDGSENPTYTLSFVARTRVYTVRFTPSVTTRARDNGYDDTLSLCPSSLVVTYTPLPLNTGKCHSLCKMGPSGTRGIYFEKSLFEHSLRKLILFVGPLPKFFKSNIVRSAEFLGNTADMSQERDPDLYDPQISRRVIFPGIGTRMKERISNIAFDECSGRVCFKKTDGSIVCMDFLL